MSGQGYYSNYLQTMRMLTEAQAVISYRMMGAAGLWPVARTEMWRMALEKGPAFAAASQEAWMATIAGKSPDRVAEAWLRPIAQHTSSNNKRLSRRR